MSDTVAVACKLPNGLKLRIFDMVDHDEPVMGGGYRTVKVAHPIGETVTLNGCAAPFGIAKHLIGGYALTPGVNAEFFAKWMEQNAESDLVKNGIIFARERDTQGQAREQAEIRSGLEPMAQKGDPRAPKRIAPASETVEAA